MTRAEAWKRFDEARTLFITRGPPEVGGRRRVSCLWVGAAPKGIKRAGIGRTPEAAIADAFGETLED